MVDPIQTATSYEEEATEGRTLNPHPSAEQDAFWEEIYSRLSMEDFERRDAFIKLPPAMQAHLASVKLAREVGMIGKQFALESWQVAKVAKVIEYTALGEYRVAELGTAIMNEARISSDIADEVAGAIRPLLNAPEEGGVAPGFLRREMAALPQAASPRATDTITEAPSFVRDATPESQRSSDDKPFMIHEEKPLFSSSPREGNPTFSFKSSDPVKRNSAPLSPTAKIDTPRQGSSSARVVHYSNLRTILSKERLPVREA